MLLPKQTLLKVLVDQFDRYISVSRIAVVSFSWWSVCLRWRSTGLSKIQVSRTGPVKLRTFGTPQEVSLRKPTWRGQQVNKATGRLGIKLNHLTKGLDWSIEWPPGDCLDYSWPKGLGQAQGQHFSILLSTRLPWQGLVSVFIFWSLSVRLVQLCWPI